MWLFQKQPQDVLFEASRDGDSATVLKILCENNLSADTTGSASGGDTPLFAASANGHPRVVELLLTKGRADPDRAIATRGGATPLFAACANGHAEVARVLLAKGRARVNKPKASSGATPLLVAAQKGHAAVVEVLIGVGHADVSLGIRPTGVPNSPSSPALYTSSSSAASSKKSGSGYGAGVQTNVKAAGATPLFVASQGGHAEVVELLIKAGADVDAPGAGADATSLFAASAAGHANVVAILIDRGHADTNKPRKSDGASPIFAACANGHVSVVELLVARGADPRRPLPKLRLTPLHIAVIMGHAHVVAALLRAGVAADGMEEGAGATECNDCSECEPQDYIVVPPLHMAAARGNTEIVSLLASCGADCERPVGLWGMTPLCIACRAARPLIAHLLIDEACVGVETPTSPRDPSFTPRPPIVCALVGRDQITCLYGHELTEISTKEELEKYKGAHHSYVVCSACGGWVNLPLPALVCDVCSSFFLCTVCCAAWRAPPALPSGSPPGSPTLSPCIPTSTSSLALLPSPPQTTLPSPTKKSSSTITPPEAPTTSKRSPSPSPPAMDIDTQIAASTAAMAASTNAIEVARTIVIAGATVPEVWRKEVKSAIGGSDLMHSLLGLWRACGVAKIFSQEPEQQQNEAPPSTTTTTEGPDAQVSVKAPELPQIVSKWVWFDMCIAQPSQLITKLSQRADTQVATAHILDEGCTGYIPFGSMNQLSVRMVLHLNRDLQKKSKEKLSTINQENLFKQRLQQHSKLMVQQCELQEQELFQLRGDLMRVSGELVDARREAATAMHDLATTMVELEWLRKQMTGGVGATAGSTSPAVKREVDAQRDKGDMGKQSDLSVHTSTDTIPKVIYVEPDADTGTTKGKQTLPQIVTPPTAVIVDSASFTNGQAPTKTTSGDKFKSVEEMHEEGKSLGSSYGSSTSPNSCPTLYTSGPASDDTFSSTSSSSVHFSEFEAASVVSCSDSDAAFCVTTKGSDSKKPQKVIVKCTSSFDFTSRQTIAQSRYGNEMFVLNMLPAHENILHPLTSFIDTLPESWRNLIQPPKPFSDSVMLNVVSPYGGKPFCAMQDKVRADPNLVKSLLLQLLSGVAHLQFNQIVHRNLCSDTLIVEEEEGVCTVKITNFELATICDSTELSSTLEPNTLAWGDQLTLAPDVAESINSHGSSATEPVRYGQADTFAAGVVIWNLLDTIPTTITDLPTTPPTIGKYSCIVDFDKLPRLDASVCGTDVVHVLASLVVKEGTKCMMSTQEAIASLRK
ncbi:Ankyrin repeat protein [Pelomyxa schiedti]|nr:Ankyrin repeat protein [Pelomyxa schiedti]